MGGIVGGATGAALGVLLAKQLGLTGFKKWALIAAATAGGAVLGAFLGPYMVKLAKSASSTLRAAIKTTGKSVPKAACFVAGTLINSETGYVPIEEIKVGDYVYAENPETGDKGLKKVVQVFKKETNELIHMKVDNQNITTTPEHPFYVAQKGWVEAKELCTGDSLLLRSGETVIIEFIQSEIINSPVTVYNFEVEDFHTYYVTDSNILVHNSCGMNNLRTLKDTVIKGYKVSMDLERGGSGLTNIHLKVGNTKYFYKAGKFINAAGKEIPNVLRSNPAIKSALQKALDTIAKGW